METRRPYPVQALLKLVDAQDDALVEADALVICTEWQHFRTPDFDLIKSALNQAVIFDGRNLYEPEKMANLGFVYYAIGRGASVKRPNEG